MKNKSCIPLGYPSKGGVYTVQYKDEQGQYQREVINYSKSDGKWEGAKPFSFYEENVTSWFYGDITVPSESMHKAYMLLGKE